MPQAHISGQDCTGKLKSLVPLLLEIEPKIRFYTPQKKQAILDGIKKIEESIHLF